MTVPDDYRLSIDRDSIAFRSVYALRTEAERYNSRFKQAGCERVFVRNVNSVKNLNTIAHISLLSIAIAAVITKKDISYRSVKSLKRLSGHNPKSIFWKSHCKACLLYPFLPISRFCCFLWLSWYFISFLFNVFCTSLKVVIINMLIITLLNFNCNSDKKGNRSCPFYHSLTPADILFPSICLEQNAKIIIAGIITINAASICSG